VSLRQSQGEDCNRLDSICSNVPVNFDAEIHGAHTWCYKNFTNVSRPRGRCVESPEEPVAGSSRISGRSRLLLSSPQSTLFPQNQCIFCGKNPQMCSRY